MSAASPAPSDPETPDGPAAWERALLDRQLEALERLADMGMAMAAAIEQRVTAEAAAEAPAAELRHAAMDFARVSRAVRMTFALQSRLIAEFKGMGRARAAPAEDARAEAERKLRAMTDEEIDRMILGPDWPPPPEEVRRSEALEIVRKVILTCGQPVPDIEALKREAAERIEQDDIALEILNRPIGEIVALICRDLGFEPDWEAIAEKPWAQAEIAKGSPFAAWLGERAEQAAPAPVPQAASP